MEFCSCRRRFVVVSLLGCGIGSEVCGRVNSDSGRMVEGKEEGEG